MSSKETSVKMSLERPSLTSSSSATTTTSTPSITPSIHPSTPPTTPAVEKEEEPLAAAPLALTAKPPIPGANKHPLSPLERDYDPSRDDLPIEQLLARPRLPRSPAESFHKAALNGRTMKPLKAAAVAGAGASGDSARDIETAKEKLRAASVEVGRMTFSKKEE